MKFSVRTTAIAAIIIIAIILGIVTPKETQAEVKQTYFEEGFGLGYVTCIASGLNGTSKGEEIVSNLGRFEGSMFLSFIHKKIQLTYFWKGSFNNGSFPSKYSSYGSDTAVASESRFMINSMDFNAKWNGLLGGPFDVRPIGGLNLTLIKADIVGSVKSTGQKVSYLSDTYRKIEPLVGVSMVIPVYPLNPRLKKVVLGIEPEYNYVFGEQNLNILKGQIFWDVSNPEKKGTQYSKIFLSFERDKGRIITLNRWSGGVWIRTPVESFLRWKK